jgi:hypothetical protein
MMMNHKRNDTREYRTKDAEWANGWAVVADPVRFAARFNRTVPGAYRYVTGDDIRQMEHCGLISRSGFFDRSDLETVRGILQYEQFRERIIENEFEDENAEIVSV